MTLNNLAKCPDLFKNAGASGIMLILGSLCVAPAQAEESISTSANVAFVSDYRFRGVTFSGGDPTVQLNAEMGYQNFSAGIWGSGLGAGGGYELDLYGFYSTQVGPVAVSGGILGYMYFGADTETSFDDSTMEIALGASYDVMPTVSVGADLAYAPIETSFYISANTSVALPYDVSLDVNIGGYVTDTAVWGNKTFDYGVALGYTIGQFDLGFGWYGNDGGKGGSHNGNVVFSLTLAT